MNAARCGANSNLSASQSKMTMQQTQTAVTPLRMAIAAANGVNVKATAEQQPHVQWPTVENALKVRRQKAEAAANEQGDPDEVDALSPAVPVDVLAIRNAFADSVRADDDAGRKVAVCADLFRPLQTHEQVREATRHAVYGYILGRAGEQKAEQFYAMRNGSEHELYKVASNAVKRAKNRASKKGWIEPKAPNSGERTAYARTTEKHSGLVAEVRRLLASNADFVSALSYAVDNPKVFTDWAKASSEAREKQQTPLRLAA